MKREKHFPKNNTLIFPNNEEYKRYYYIKILLRLVHYLKI
jgi:hypothetical protein